MKRSCTIWLAVYLLLAAAAGAVAYRRYPDPSVAAGAGFVGGAVLWMAVGYFAGIARKFGTASMIKRALNDDAPRDGQKIAAIGRLSPSGGALTSPLSKSACVAYRYEIRSGPLNDDASFYEGFALTPSVIQGRQRSIRLLAMPDFKTVGWQTVPAAQAQGNAEEYIAATNFRESILRDFKTVVADTIAMYKDTDGSVRWDQKGVQPPLDAGKPIDLQRATYREQLLRPGDSVCVIGTYSAERGGIVPSDHPLMDPVTLEVGEREAFTGRAATGAVGYFIGGLIFTAIAALALIIFCALVPLNTPHPTPVEIRFERFLDARVRPLLNKASAVSKRSTSRTLALGEAKGWVKAAGRNQTVTRASAQAIGNATTIHIDDDALVMTVTDSHTVLRLAVFGQDVPPDAATVWVYELKDNLIDGRVTITSDNSRGPACRVWFRAER